MPLVLLKRLPPKGKKLLVFGTISELGFLDSTGFCYTFAVTYHVPMLNTNDAEKVLEQLNVFADDDVDAAAEGLNDLYMLIEMAVQGEQGGSPKLSIPTKRRLRSLTSTTTLGMFVRL